MRKVSKSRTDDDVVSSTNGSIANDVEPEPEKSEEKEPEKSDAEPASDNDNDKDADYNEDGPKEKAKKRGRPKSQTPKKKKAGKSPAKKGEEYEVEKIVGSKKIKGKQHYLIRWKGYSSDTDTWEPANVVSCPDLISKFKEEQKENAKTNAKKPTKKKGKKRGAKESKSGSPGKKTKTSWDSEDADEEAEYEVERILEVHHKKSGDREFLIHWKGWSSKFDSWEPEEHLNCEDLIKKFMDKVDSAKKSDSRSLRVAPGTTNRFTLQDPSHGRRLSKRRGQKQRVRYDDAE